METVTAATVAARDCLGKRKARVQAGVLRTLLGCNTRLVFDHCCTIRAVVLCYMIKLEGRRGPHENSIQSLVCTR